MQEGGSRFDYTYQDGRLVRESGSDGTVQTYQYNVAGNRASCTSSGPEAYQITYAYDRNNRLQMLCEVFP